MQVITQYLQGYVNYQQDNWIDLLPLAEYCHNLTFQSSIKCTPFYAARGHEAHPFQIKEAKRDKSISATEFTEVIKDLHSTLQMEIMNTQNKQALYYDRGCKPITFQVSDMVWLRSTNLQTSWPCKKLEHKQFRPFKVA